MRKPRTIRLPSGERVRISPQDYDLVAQYRWHIQRGRQNYAMATIDGKTVYMHRLIMGAEKGQIVDHINTNGLDNRRENLRLCTHAENLRNRTKVNGNVKYKGVHKVKGRKSAFTANIGVDGKNIYLGYFRCPVAAAKAYNEAALKYHGAFASLNPV